MCSANAARRDNAENRDNPGKIARPPLVLAVETSSRIGSVALALGDTLLEESAFSNPMQHSAEIFPAIGDLLTRHDYRPPEIDQIHIAVGPGSFTGLRIAVTLAKAMFLARRVRIVTVDSLDVVAANLSDPPRDPAAPPGSQRAAVPNRIAALFDAKRGQFYVSVYDRVPLGQALPQGPGDETPQYRIPAPNDAAWHKILPDSLMTAREILGGFSGVPIGVLGDGLLYRRGEFIGENITVLPERYWSPRAAGVYRLGRQKALAGRFADPLTLIPFYLRGPQVTVKRRS